MVVTAIFLLIGLTYYLPTPYRNGLNIFGRGDLNFDYERLNPNP